MDGAFVINVRRKIDKVLELKFSKKYTDGEEVFMSAICSNENLKAELLTAAQNILIEVEKRGWETPDTIALKNMLSSYV